MQYYATDRDNQLQCCTFAFVPLRHEQDVSSTGLSPVSVAFFPIPADRSDICSEALPLEIRFSVFCHIGLP